MSEVRAGSGSSRRPRAASSGTGVVFSVDECWLGGWRGPSVLSVGEGGIRLVADADARPTRHLPGTVLPGFVDSHVHLGLVDADGLVAGGIAAVDDLGWDPAIAKTWASSALPEVRFAGAFLTAPGGYPSDRSWAPTESIEEVASASDASAAVDRQLVYGASQIKITLNTDAGPTFDTATLTAIVRHAHVRGITVTAHVQGAGQAARAFEAGVDRLAHTPWTERLDDELLTAMAGPRARTLSGAQTWVSTLDIHGYGAYGADFEVAQDNLRRFHAFGGHVVYGTDLGNGPLPLGVNARELRALAGAGLDENAVIRSIAAAQFGKVLSYIPGARPGAPVGSQPGSQVGSRGGDLAGWLATASVITVSDIITGEFV